MPAHRKCDHDRAPNGRCRPCSNATKKALLDANREALRANRRARYANDAEYRERYRASNRAVYHRAPEKQYARQAARRARLAGALGSHTNAEWKAILAAARGRCAICGKSASLQKDHIVPLAAGGTDYAYNLQAACEWCNNAKNCRLPVVLTLALIA